MKRIYLWLISLLSGVLLWGAWPTGGFTPLVFAALVPLLWVEDYVLERQRERDGKHYHIFLYSFSAFLVWNVLTTWWVWKSTPAAAAAFLANSALMAGCFSLFHYTCRHFFKKGMRYSILCLYWLGFEHLHHHWDISWPWLILGNVFSQTPQWVQWYEITGPLGGSLWVLVCNIALLYAVKNWREPKLRRRSVIIAVCWMAVPVAGSLIRFVTYREKGREVEVVAVQPNIDPYYEQFTWPAPVSTLRMIDIARPYVTPQTRYIVTPESMVQEDIWEENLPYGSVSLHEVYEFLQDYPDARLIAGITSYTRVKPQDSAQSGVRCRWRETDPERRFYRAHNSTVLVGPQPASPVPLHHKSRLTPGVEIMPFAGRVKFIEKMAVNLGGTVGTLGVEDRPFIFGGTHGGSRGGEAAPDTTRFASIICYESVFGDYVAECVRDGAELLFISTNDAWWGNTPGHRQHASYARLRAVENRRDIARSANTGISCFIDQRGCVYQKTAYEEPACIRQTLHAQSRLTFYSKYGDIIGRCSGVLSLFFLLLTFVYRIFPGAWRDFRRQKEEI